MFINSNLEEMMLEDETYITQLRDEFAKVAMKDMLEKDIEDLLTFKKIAQLSYSLADCMMEERK